MKNNITFLDKNKCGKGYPKTGQCCCNCKHQKKLMCHPQNGNQKEYHDRIKFGKGNTDQICGWICSVEYEDGSNHDRVIFSDNEHGMCEYHTWK